MAGSPDSALAAYRRPPRPATGAYSPIRYRRITVADTDTSPAARPLLAVHELSLWNRELAGRDVELYV